MAGVAYTGSDRLGCSLAMDKEVTKRLLRDAGIPVFGPSQAAAQKTVPEQYERAIEKIGFYPIVRAGLARLIS